ncbi:MAG: DNA polymerase III subunit gamma/tau [Dehalococcoidia bacterium]
MSQALYRKWRAQSFGELAGQEPVTRTLKNAIAGNRTSHAYLFCGPRGTGKTSTGRILAKALNCLAPQEGEPCNACAMCLAVNEGRLMDLVEIDAASNRGIDEIRDLRDKVRFAPSEARRKVYIIDEVHMLTEQAFNALLKTLEEPPEHVVFILATTESHKLPATIVSRCQRFDFRRIRADAALAKLRTIADAEGIEADDTALGLIVRSSAGSLRDAENLLDQAASYYGPRFDVADLVEMLGIGGDQRARGVVEAALRRDLPTGLVWLNQAGSDGVDLRQFNREIVELLRRTMLTQAGSGDLIDASEDEREFLQRMAGAAAPDRVVSVTRRFADLDLRPESSGLLSLELALYDACTDVGEQAASSDQIQGNWPTVQVAAVESSGNALRAEPAIARRATRPRAAERSVPAEPFLPTGNLNADWAGLVDGCRSLGADATILVSMRRLQPVRIDGESVVAAAPSPSDLTKVERRKSQIEGHLAALFGRPVRLTFELQDVARPVAPSPTAPTPTAPALIEPAAEESEATADDVERLVAGPLVQHALKQHGAQIAAVEHK